MTENEFLSIYEEKVSELKYKKRKLDATEDSLRFLLASLDNQAAALRKEQADVSGLEKLSIKNLFIRITNRMDDVTKKEEQEYFDAKVRYDELQNSIQMTEKDKKNMQSDISAIERELINLKENGRRQFPEIDRKFAEAENEIVQLKSEVKELDEAIVSGNNVCAAINRAIEKLEKARGWATYDMFTKGGIFLHMAKYDNIDDAQETIKEIGYLVDVFQLELKDVNITFNSGFDSYDGTTRFIDFFFDNIFTDMNIRGRITDDINQLNELKNNIESITTKLISSRESKRKQISGLE